MSRLVQALILAGGVGTRLRPLTARTPKPVVTLVDRPFIVFMLEWLRAHGVDEVVLSCGFLAASVRDVLGDGDAYGLRLLYVEEQEPLGTGGALKHAEGLLGERFIVCNGDVLTDMDLSEQLAQHANTGAAATLALARVEDPSAYRLVRVEDDLSVREFFEKPDAGGEQFDSLISAGVYVLERSVLDLIPAGRPVSIEREIWPLLIGSGMYGYVASGYWLDIGSPRGYLQASFDLIEGQVDTSLATTMGTDHVSLAPSARIDGRVVPAALIGEGCELDSDVHAGSQVILGQGVKVGAGARLERAVILAGAQIGERCVLRDCVVGERVRIGAHTEVSGGAVIGQDAVIGEHNMITAGARISPGVVLGDRAVAF
ncbi:MAG TPA: NDP-sugar synthase [Solirubrobacteraceae bacterium]|nr:NDP-sugar synthase [Solirubrobacteraceae bacterium]